MNTNNIPLNNSPFMIESRNFDYQEANLLASEVNRSYTDTANAVNNRTIGIFPMNRPLNTGESWFVNKNQRQQGLRQVYYFDDTHLIIPHGINVANVDFFKSISGSFTSGATYAPLPYVDVTNVNNQIAVFVNATNIVITKGAGSPPSITKGYIVLEWISKP